MTRLERTAGKNREVFRGSRSVWDAPNTKTNLDAPSVKKAMAGEKWKRRALFIVAFGALPAMFLMGAGMLAQVSNADGLIAAPDSLAVNDSRGKAEAHRAVQGWLQASPAPIPGAVLVSWNGFSVETAPPPKPGSTTERVAPYWFETHTFTIARGENMWEASIQVTVHEVYGATATSTPSLQPLLNVAVTPSETWFNVVPVSPTAEVRKSIDTWAAAFTSGDSDRLRQTIQDRDATRSYVPLYGVGELVDIRVVASASPHSSDGVTAQSDVMILRVELRFWWAGETPMAGGVTPTPITFDIRVEYANTATPVVVAWGAPGSGSQLTAYSNAVHVKIQDPKQSLPDRPAPEPSETAEPDTGGDESGGDE